MDLLYMIAPHYQWYSRFGIELYPDKQNYWYCGLYRKGCTPSFSINNYPTIEAAQLAFIQGIKEVIKGLYTSSDDERVLMLYKRYIK